MHVNNICIFIEKCLKEYTQKIFNSEENSISLIFLLALFNNILGIE